MGRCTWPDSLLRKQGGGRQSPSGGAESQVCADINASERPPHAEFAGTAEAETIAPGTKPDGQYIQTSRGEEARLALRRKSG